MGRLHHLRHRQRRERHRWARRPGRRLGAVRVIAFTGIAFWALRIPAIYGDVVNPYDLAVLAAAFAGACAGFVWWNAAPARIFMGDVGALALGTALALLALTTNARLLLVLICGINVVEAGSVGLQMTVCRASGRRRRLVRLAPLHHHFELAGQPETTVIVRFWLITGACVAAAVAVFVSDYTTRTSRPDAPTGATERRRTASDDASTTVVS